MSEWSCGEPPLSYWMGRSDTSIWREWQIPSTLYCIPRIRWFWKESKLCSYLFYPPICLPEDLSTASFISQTPDDNRWVRAISKHHSLDSVEPLGLPIRIIGQTAHNAWGQTHRQEAEDRIPEGWNISMGFDVCFINDYDNRGGKSYGSMSIDHFGQGRWRIYHSSQLTLKYYDQVLEEANIKA